MTNKELLNRVVLMLKKSVPAAGTDEQYALRDELIIDIEAELKKPYLTQELVAHYDELGMRTEDFNRVRSSLYKTVDI
jgi:hypothetical protein